MSAAWRPPTAHVRALSREFALVCDADGLIAWADERAERMLGAREGVGFVTLAVSGEEAEVTRLLRDAAATLVEDRTLMLRVGGLQMPATFRAAPEVGRVLLVGSVAPSNALQRELARLLGEQLARSERAEGQLANLLEWVTDAFFALDTAGVVSYANGGAARLLGARAGRPLWHGLPAPASDAVREAWTRVRARRMPVVAEVPLGPRRWAELRLYPGQSRAVGFLADVTTRQEREEGLRREARHDPLTGLPNRRVFEELLERVVARAARGTGATLLLADLDGFKALNDQLGHPAGDEGLRRVGGALAAIVRPGDLVARLGGDEFGVLLLGEGRVEGALPVAERLRSAVESLAFGVAERPLRLGLSVGVATIDGRLDSREVVARADAALYAAKAGGGNRIVVAEPQGPAGT
jgi:diguanylate cyclase (GGDEF)-like protein/PAS domain S-box-containing protein